MLDQPKLMVQLRKIMGGRLNSKMTHAQAKKVADILHPLNSELFGIMLSFHGANRKTIPPAQTMLWLKNRAMQKLANDICSRLEKHYKSKGIKC